MTTALFFLEAMQRTEALSGLPKTARATRGHAATMASGGVWGLKQAQDRTATL